MKEENRFLPGGPGGPGAAPDDGAEAAELLLACGAGGGLSSRNQGMESSFASSKDNMISTC